MADDHVAKLPVLLSCQEFYSPLQDKLRNCGREGRGGNRQDDAFISLRLRGTNESMCLRERNFGTTNSSVSSLLVGQDLVGGCVIAENFGTLQERREERHPGDGTRFFDFHAAHIDVVSRRFREQDHVVSMSKFWFHVLTVV